VDEYQDTNALQAEILKALRPSGEGVTVVGDDAQSIYSFRAATVENILGFPVQYTPAASVVTLEENYRSTQGVLDAANALIAEGGRQYKKTLRATRGQGERPRYVTVADDQGQADYVVARVLETRERGIALKRQAVLFRNSHHSDLLELELVRRNIPYVKYGGLKFLEAAHVKDVLAFLRILENPRDEVSWYRLLLLLPGIGDATARAAIDAMASAAWESTAFGRYSPPPRARAAHAALVGLLEGLRAGPILDEAQVAADISRVRLLYDNILRERYDKVEPRLADLDQLQIIAAGYPDRATFLSALALEPPQATQDLATGTREDDDCLILSTAHSAKGKEWDAVFVIWAVDGWFPSARCLNDDEETEEERRLMYVALTRARNHLSVSYPLNAYSSRRGADYSLDQLCRFIDRGVRDNMQRVALGGDAAPAPPEERRTEPLLDLRALLRSRFSSPGSPGSP
jgi:DNA helicase-2/ATP-dependent DNA helicase PcrA